MRKSLKAIILATSLALAGCGGSSGGGNDSPENVQPPTLLGAISGRVFSSDVVNNKIIYEPYVRPEYDFNNSAYVHVIGKNIETTTASDGTFRLNNVPAGVWEIEAKTEKTSPFSVPKDSATVLVAGNALTIMGGLDLITEPIIEGYAKNSPQNTPYVGQLDFYPSNGSNCFGSPAYSTITDSNGYYAFLRSKPNSGDWDYFCMGSPTKAIKFNTGNYWKYIPFAYDIAQEDLIAQ
ncbi:MAG: hypothetical protein AABX93_03280 [Nanoarchaeota archaeon]